MPPLERTLRSRDRLALLWLVARQGRNAMQGRVIVLELGGGWR